MWRVIYEDDTAVDDQNTYWTDLPKDKLIVKVTLFNGTPFIGRELSGMDSYYYAKEAICMITGGPPNVVAEIMGGVNLETQTIEELRFDHRTKEVSVCSKSLSEYTYSKEILLPGKK